ncbi:hypothetical protein EDD21DRAFT_361705 [Dissophora ornata]|nr:hypothetical protein BGZ58_008409 [Dissophora ornata]KAI8606179.1 hypothetical protein EDD21DRAFT_361705 [Dissophora ornata]
MSQSTQSPFDLPELLTHLSRFVLQKDAVACAQVCKAWSEEFLSVVWHTVDSRLIEKHMLDPAAIAKNGHHIRVVENLEAHLPSSLWSPSVCKLQSLDMSIGDTPSMQDIAKGILQNNYASLTDVSVSRSHVDISSIIVFSFDGMPPAIDTVGFTNLVRLTITGVGIMREPFSSMLRMCPVLQHLTIRDTWLYLSDEGYIYQHQGLNHLSTTIQQIILSDPDAPDAPSLLAHFPNLKRLSLLHSTVSMEVDFEDFGNEVSRCCPLLKSLDVLCENGMTLKLLNESFQALTEICLSYPGISQPVIDAVISHRGSLERLSAAMPLPELELIRSALEEMGLAVGATDGQIQLLPRMCHRLKHFNLELHKMDIKNVEAEKWTCADLETLHVKFRGLDTTERIDRALRMWVDGREKAHQSAGEHQDDTTTILQDGSLEARVARHLLQFKRLREVCLGSRVWKVDSLA